MKYTGKRFQSYLDKHPGSYTELANAMRKYKKARKNGGNGEYSLSPFLRDGHNITVNTLSALMRETGMSIDFFIDFEPGELPGYRDNSVQGSRNVVNSTITNDLTMKVDHLTEVINLKNQMLSDKDRIIAMKDSEIEQWKKRFDDLIKSFSDKNGTL